jgi:hypothetical protein
MKEIKSGTPKQLGQCFFHDQFIINCIRMYFFNNSVINNPSKTQFVKKNDFFSIHSFSSLRQRTDRDYLPGRALPGAVPQLRFNTNIVAEAHDL